MYENKFVEMYDKVFDYPLPELDIAFERDDEEEIVEDEILPTTTSSKDNQESAKNQPKFRLMACKNPLGRPHGCTVNF